MLDNFSKCVLFGFGKHVVADPAARTTLRSRLFARLGVARAMSCAMSPAMFSHNKAVIIRVRAAACCAAIDAGGAG